MRILPFLLFCLILKGLPFTAVSAQDDETAGLPDEERSYSNPVLATGADPWIIKQGPFYYYCSAAGNGIFVSRWGALHRPEESVPVWVAPRSGWNTNCIWAPELHYLEGRWYIYYAAGVSGPPYIHQRAGVLESISDHPFGPYIDRGMLYTGDNPQDRSSAKWAIDLTVLEWKGKLYAIWSGWEQNETTDKTKQHLYIAPMDNPYTISSARVKISSPDQWYETGPELNLNEGPQVLKRPATLKQPGDLYIVYSCGQSWLPSYQLSWLRLRDEKANPLLPQSWIKSETPVFVGTDSVFGVGHASFTTSPDNKEWYIVYHAKRSKTAGWERDVRLQLFNWNPDGTPNFGTPVPSGLELPLPSGTK